jgi:hypothetical protein
MNDGSGDPVIEAAAIFHVLSVDEGRLGRQGRLTLPVVVAMQYLFEHRLMVRDAAELRRLQDEIAGGLGWEETRAWFLERVVPRPRSRIFGPS